MKKINQNGFSIIETGIVLFVIVSLVAIGGFVKSKQGKQNNSQGSNTPAKVSSQELANPRQFIQHDFIDLTKVFSVSKFRSAEGHDFSDGNETCRSMKHYFNQQFDKTVAETMGRNNGVPPQPDGKTDVAIYAPVTGVITRIESERMPIGEQLYIVPDAAKDYTIRLFHIYKSNGIQKGSKITAGQQIGVISKGVSTDISVDLKGNFVSYFSVMPDSIFDTYKTRGLKSRDDVILSKEYRDAHPVPCNQERGGNQQFTYPDGYDHVNDISKLTGYIDPATFGQYDTHPNKQ